MKKGTAFLIAAVSLLLGGILGILLSPARGGFGNTVNYYDTKDQEGQSK